MRDIPCGTKGGVMITFGKIEVMIVVYSTKDNRVYQEPSIPYDLFSIRYESLFRW